MPICEDFIFLKAWHMGSFVKIYSSRKFPNLQYPVGLKLHSHFDVDNFSGIHPGMILYTI